MKPTRILFLIGLILVAFVACKSDDPKTENQEQQGKEPGLDNNNDPIMERMIIKVGTSEFKATLANNATAKAFITRLPLSVNMVELNGNEKYFNLPDNLPSNPLSPGRIEAGDLLLYNSNTLVLFYESFNTSYRYTRIGKIDNPEGLSRALGSGNIAVDFNPE